MEKYTNSKLRTLSIEGNTISDKAIQLWNEMNWMERSEISQKVYDYSSSILKQRACVNYIAEFLL